MWKFIPAFVVLLLVAGPSQASEREYKRVLSTISRWEKENPRLITRRSIGKSRQGRDLTVLRLSYSKDDSLPGIYLGSSIHGIEYSHQDLIIGIDGLLKQCQTKQGRALLSTRVVWVQLMMNPDGVRNSTRKNAAGVDLNRNFGYRWGENWKNKRERRARSWRYPGSKEFSEPESIAVRDFLKSHASISVYFDFHRSAHIIFAPFGAERRSLPKPFL
ncbi:MAG: M14 family metallopeptidase, partial [Planctomycetota bacterium]|nr:M14 family metallopeptidase [Planctomycetota bacterium]